MSKLDELKTAIETHDKGAAEWQQLENHIPHAGKMASELRVVISIDTAKALLEVVEATKAIPTDSFRQPSEIDSDCFCSVCGGEWDNFDKPQHKPDCLLVQLQSRLKALE